MAFLNNILLFHFFFVSVVIFHFNAGTHILAKIRTNTSCLLFLQDAAWPCDLGGEWGDAVFVEGTGPPNLTVWA